MDDMEELLMDEEWRARLKDELADWYRGQVSGWY